SAADFEDFLEPRPELAASMESELTEVVRVLAANRWPFRLHATYNESIQRALNVFEAVNREIPLEGLHWFIDHAETIDAQNIDRIRALGGGIAIQHRIAYQGEYFVDRYGAAAAAHSPPIRRMLDAGVPVGAGTDATRVASYRAARRFGSAVSRLLLCPGRGDQTPGVVPDHRRRKDCLRAGTVRQARAPAASGDSGLVACCGVWRLLSIVSPA